MPTLEELQKQIAELQRQLAAQQPIQYAPTGTPYANPALREGVEQFDYEQFARENPERARAAVLSMVDGMLGAHRAPQTPERDANIDRYIDGVYNRQLYGAFRLGELGVADFAYLARKQSAWHGRWGRDIWEGDVIAGTWRAITAAASLGESLRNDYNDDQVYPPLRQYVEARL